MIPPDCALVGKTALGCPVDEAELAVFPAPVLVVVVLDVHLANGLGDSAAAFEKLGPSNELPDNLVPGGAFEAASVVSCAPSFDGMVTGTVRDCTVGMRAAREVVLVLLGAWDMEEGGVLVGPPAPVLPLL